MLRRPREAALSSAKFLSASAALAQALRPSTPQPPRRFSRRPTAARDSAASHPWPTSADQQLLPPFLRRRFPRPPRSGGREGLILPIPPRVEGSGRFPVDVGHCSRLRHPPPLSLPSPASFTIASRPDHVSRRRGRGSAAGGEDLSGGLPFLFRLLCAPFFPCQSRWVGLHRPPSTSKTRASTSRFTRHLAAPSASVGATGFGSFRRPSLRSVSQSSRPLENDKDAKALLHLRGIRSSGAWSTFSSYVVQEAVRRVRRGGAASLPARRFHGAFSQVIWIQVSVFASLVCGGPRRRRRSPSTTRSVSPSSLAPLQSAPASSLSSPTGSLRPSGGVVPAVSLVRLLSRFLFPSPSHRASLPPPFRRRSLSSWRTDSTRALAYVRYEGGSISLSLSFSSREKFFSSLTRFASVSSPSSSRRRGPPRGCASRFQSLPD